jgi:uncharacterized RDD family membrane protein YckC
MSVVPAEPPASEPVHPEPVPPEPVPPEPALPASVAGEDLLGVRIGAALIDLALLYGLAVVLSVTIGQASTASDGFEIYLYGADFGLYLGLVLVYYFALEATIGHTVGKLLVGLRVVRPDGARPSVWAVAIRTVVRVVDWLPLLYLAGFITMLATGARRQRLGDLAARTGIARAAPIRHRGLAAAATAFTLVRALAGAFVYAAASDKGEEANTYRDHGVSFDYPAGWVAGSLETPEANQLWGKFFGPSKYDVALVGAYQVNLSVTEENLDSVKPELDRRIRQLFEQEGGTVQAGPEEITVAGKPALRFRVTGTVDGTPYKSMLQYIFDGTTEYYVNCQHTAEQAEEIERGCEQILRTFNVD